MPLSLHFVHGWGCDAAMWDALAPLLAELPQTRADRGYFGGLGEAAGARCIVVAHSHGVLRALLDPPPGCVGMVAINGFDRFGAERVLARMIARFASDPAGVVAAFRARIGAPPPTEIAEAAALAADLEHMQHADARGLRWPHPLVALHGRLDPILPADLRDAAFAAAPMVHAETLAAGGHMLPVSDPAWCAGPIRAMAERLA